MKMWKRINSEERSICRESFVVGRGVSGLCIVETFLDLVNSVCFV